MARPTKLDKRDRQLNLKLMMRELCWVQARGAEAGMRPTEFGRARVLDDEPHQRVAEAQDSRHDRLLLVQLSRLGNNLNQIARRLHELRMPAPFELAPLLKDIRDALAKGMRRGP